MGLPRAVVRALVVGVVDEGLLLLLAKRIGKQQQLSRPARPVRRRRMSVRPPLPRSAPGRPGWQPQPTQRRTRLRRTISERAPDGLLPGLHHRNEGAAGELVSCFRDCLGGELAGRRGPGAWSRRQLGSSLFAEPAVERRWLALNAHHPNPLAKAIPSQAMSNLTLAATLLQAARARYAAAHPRSKLAFDEAVGVLPGGGTRSSIFVDPFPLHVASGTDDTITDLDGHVYLDMCVVWASAPGGMSSLGQGLALTRAALASLLPLTGSPTSRAACTASRTRSSRRPSRRPSMTACSSACTRRTRPGSLAC